MSKKAKIKKGRFFKKRATAPFKKGAEKEPILILRSWHKKILNTIGMIRNNFKEGIQLKDRTGQFGKK